MGHRTHASGNTDTEPGSGADPDFGIWSILPITDLAILQRPISFVRGRYDVCADEVTAVRIVVGVVALAFFVVAGILQSVTDTVLPIHKNRFTQPSPGSEQNPNPGWDNSVATTLYPEKDRAGLVVSRAARL